MAAPVLLGLSGVFDSWDLAAPVAEYLSGSNRWKENPWWPYLLAYVLLTPLAYCFGSWIGGLLRRRTPSPDVPSRLSWGMLAVYAVLLALFAAEARDLLFTGYLEGVDVTVIGPIATMATVLLLHWLVCKNAGERWQALVTAVLLLIACVVLLSMGGRLYAVSILVAVYFRWWNWGARSNQARRWSAVWLFAVPFALAVLGMWRTGETDSSTLSFYLLVESLFTSISMLSLMLGGTWSWLDMPREFFSAFLNIVPTVLWPDKAESVGSLLDSNLTFESPFGAMNILASSVGNFGYVGGLVFLALVGFIMGRVARNATSVVDRALYCYLACLLPFEFYRDPMRVQVKLVVTGFVLAWLYRLLATRGRGTGIVAGGQTRLQPHVTRATEPVTSSAVRAQGIVGDGPGIE